MTERRFGKIKRRFNLRKTEFYFGVICFDCFELFFGGG